MTSSAERSAPHPGSKPPPPLSPPHVGGGGVRRPLLYRHRYSSFGARSGASPLTRSRGFTPCDRLDDFKRGAERATSGIKLPHPYPLPTQGEGESGDRFCTGSLYHCPPLKSLRRPAPRRPWARPRSPRG